MLILRNEVIQQLIRATVYWLMEIRTCKTLGTLSGSESVDISHLKQLLGKFINGLDQKLENKTIETSQSASCCYWDLQNTKGVMGADFTCNQGSCWQRKEGLGILLRTIFKDYWATKV